MTLDEICAEIQLYAAELVVLTGGEPALFADIQLCEAIHALGKQIAIETNGTRQLFLPIDHVTCSPKFEFCEGAGLQLTHIDELKVVYTGANDMTLYEGIEAAHYCLQPCDTGDNERNRRLQQEAVDYVLQHPKWRLSLQLHKFLNVR